MCHLINQTPILEVGGSTPSGRAMKKLEIAMFSGFLFF